MITLGIIIFVLVLMSILYFTGDQKIAVAPVATIDTQMPPYEGKEQLLGNKDDLISFSISPNVKVHGILSYRGEIQGGYFFEGNILINILDSNKKVLLASNAVAKSDWMTKGPVKFEGNINFSDLAKGPAYFEIKNDNPSGLLEHDKSILIPIVIQ